MSFPEPNRSGGTPPWLAIAKQTPFTSIILALCALVYIFSYFGASQPIEQAVIIRPLGVLMQTHEWWRLIGPVFLHFSVLHIVFNLLWWWVLGTQLERMFGTTSLVIMFLVSGVASNLAQLLVSGPNFGGLSGVVYALFGFVWWIGWLRPQWGIGLPRNLVLFLLAWLVLGYADILWVNMANEAHLFGLISGCLMALASHQIAGIKKN